MNIKFNQRNLKIAIAASILVGSAGLTVPAYAVTDTSSMQVSSNIGMNCTISTTDIAFGAYDPITTNKTNPLNAQGTVTTTCTVGSAGKVIVSQGLHAPEAGSTNADPERRMKGAGDTDWLLYGIYSKADFSAEWTNLVATGVPYTATGSAQVMQVYGTIPGGQTTAPKGSYTDTLVVTVNY